MKTILFIEADDQAFRSILSMLTGIGYSADMILRCTNINELLGMNIENVGIVLIGLSSPGADSFAKFNKVKKKISHTPIIILTDIAEKQVAVRMIQYGAQDCLLKETLDPEILERAIMYAIERHRIFDNILIEKQNLQSIINNTNDIIWSIDKAHNIILANNAYWERVRKISGKEKDEMGPADFDKDSVTTWTGFYEQALKGELNKIVWSEMYNGHKIYEEVIFHPIQDKDTNVVGVSCFSRDITKQYTHLETIKKQNEQLESIASINSHDVRGPVASILGLAQFFDLDNPGNPENIEILENINKAAGKLDDAIRRINDQTITLWYRGSGTINDML